MDVILIYPDDPLLHLKPLVEFTSIDRKASVTAS